MDIEKNSQDYQDYKRTTQGDLTETSQDPVEEEELKGKGAKVSKGNKK